MSTHTVTVGERRHNRFSVGVTQANLSWTVPVILGVLTFCVLFVTVPPLVCHSLEHDATNIASPSVVKCLVVSGLAVFAFLLLSNNGA
jgi:hypothetical protein